MLKHISHIGVAVKDLEQAMELFRFAFHATPSPPMRAAGGNIKISTVEVGDACIELLQPVGSEGVVAKFLEMRGEGVHHVCFEVDDIASSLRLLEASGLEAVGNPVIGIEGLCAFLHPKGTCGVLMELVQKA